MTLGQQVLRRYLKLQEDVEKEIGMFPMPKVPDDMSLNDLVIAICLYFSPLYATGDYRPAIRRGLAFRGVTVDNDKLEASYPLVADFLNWVIPILRK
jgi:hypothetical protein